MAQVTLITGNTRKYEELKALLGLPLAMHALDLDEIQSLDPHTVVAHKLCTAQEVLPDSAVLVEDTSLTLSCLNDTLPGPLIRWFEDALDIPGIVALAERYGDMRACARTVLGYSVPGVEPLFFEGVTEGDLVSPRGALDFGWGPAFMPRGATKTFGEMERTEKHAYSMRARAAEKLRTHLTALPQV